MGVDGSNTPIMPNAGLDNVIFPGDKELPNTNSIELDD